MEIGQWEIQVVVKVSINSFEGMDKGCSAGSMMKAVDVTLREDDGYEVDGRSSPLVEMLLTV